MFRFLMGRFGPCVAALVAAVMAPVYSASAQLTAPTSQALSGFFGSDTAGSETGVYEVSALVDTGIGVLVTIVLAFAGYMLVRRFIRGAGSGG